MISRFFKIKENNSSIKTEVLGGIATFLTMSYIIFVNPSILTSAIPEVAGNNLLHQQFFGAFMVATIIAGASATLIMGLLANYPFALAPGMGLNAYFTYVVCLKMGIDWRVALGAVFVEGIIFILITAFGIRSFVVKAFPAPVKLATSAGIGLFLAFLGLKSSGIIVADPNTFVTLNNLLSPGVLISVISLFVMATLFYKKVPGSILIGILISTVIAFFVGVAEYKGVIGAIPDISPTFLKLKISISDLLTPAFWMIVLTFFFADFFDTAGTLTGLGNAAKMCDAHGNLPNGKKAYMADAIGTTVGAIFGTSTVTTYVESGVGVLQGARTGLASVVTAILMLLALFFSPLAMSIPSQATAGALIFIGALMMTAIKAINWDDVTEALPAFVTIIAMPLTFSIANGIALGIITFVFIKLLTFKVREIPVITFLMALFFILYLLFMH